MPAGQKKQSKSTYIVEIQTEYKTTHQVGMGDLCLSVGAIAGISIASFVVTAYGGMIFSGGGGGMEGAVKSCTGMIFGVCGGIVVAVIIGAVLGTAC